MPMDWPYEYPVRLGLSATLCSAAIVQFTAPQIVRLSATSATPLPRLTAGGFATLMSRSLAPQSLITMVQFWCVRELRRAIDGVLGPRRVHLSLAYGAVSVPIVAAKYSMLTSDVFRLHDTGGRKMPSLSLSAARDLWRRRIKPGLLWSFLRDSGSIGGSIALGPLLSARVARATLGPDEEPSAALRFGCGLATGAFTGLATQILHNAALTAGRISELEGRCPGTFEAMRAVVAEHGVANAFVVNYQHRFAVIALWSAILNVLSPYDG